MIKIIWGGIFKNTSQTGMKNKEKQSKIKQNRPEQWTSLCVKTFSVSQTWQEAWILHEFYLFHTDPIFTRFT